MADGDGAEHTKMASAHTAGQWVHPAVPHGGQESSPAAGCSSAMPNLLPALLRVTAATWLKSRKSEKEPKLVLGL